MTVPVVPVVLDRRSRRLPSSVLIALAVGAIAFAVGLHLGGAPSSETTAVAATSPQPTPSAGVSTAPMNLAVPSGPPFAASPGWSDFARTFDPTRVIEALPGGATCTGGSPGAWIAPRTGTDPGGTFVKTWLTSCPIALAQRDAFLSQVLGAIAPVDNPIRDGAGGVMAVTPYEEGGFVGSVALTTRAAADGLEIAVTLEERPARFGDPSTTQTQGPATMAPDPVVTPPPPRVIAGPLPPMPVSRFRNGWIAVSANPWEFGGGENGDIYLLADGAAPRRIIGSDGDGIAQACPVFSPDGQRLAYGEARASGPVTTYRGVWPVSERAVVIVGLNDQGDPSAPIMRVTLPPDPGEIACPEWSPDGRQVAFRFGSELWVSDAASGKTTVFPVTEAPWGQQVLAWSHDGSRIAVPEPGQVHLVRMDGGASTVIPVRGGTPWSLGWTAGDDGFVYISTDPTTDTGAVNVVAADGKTDTALMLTPLTGAGRAAVSPDGSRVAYVPPCAADGCARALIMDTQGSNVVEAPIPPNFFVSALLWSPDYKRLLLSSIDGVVSVPVVPGSPAVVYASGNPNGGLNLEWSGSRVAWQPVVH